MLCRYALRPPGAVARLRLAVDGPLLYAHRARPPATASLAQSAHGMLRFSANPGAQSLALVRNAGLLHGGSKAPSRRP